MDETYLKMILALPDEFFDGWEWQAGDKALINNEVWTVFGGTRPIPSQEQLQKMMNLNPIKFIEDLFRYASEPIKNNMDISIFSIDMNCFTLAYVMDRKFGKGWDGEHWV